ncbi:uncharacterized protein LOC111704994 [Eurytemora carolleeae]|uniref:uncharacterized protein LOC111704994 n=1 Tax=Eurytemora carolleeae TaxID=1294199 RepID=UPI000C76587D|nr:uncharacterized protein LOC111704994 [Eurytemora carolleeae]|eukprot:XP_023333216.1 uncharacterized protein LOC111704994 [Eurytemora affinis]
MGVLERYSPGSEEAQGMIARSKQEALELMNDVFEHWEPKHQAWIINKSYIISSGAAALPGLILSIKFRKLLGLRKMTKIQMATLPAATVLPGIMAGVGHKILITDDILIQETECPVCVDVRSSVIQFTAGFIFPLFFSYTGAAIAATANNARIAPNNLKGWIPVTKVIFGRIPIYLGGLALIQLITSGVLVREEYNSRDLVLAELESRFIADQRRKQIQ